MRRVPVCASVVALSVLLPLGAHAAPSSPAGCPAPKTCSTYRLDGHRWPLVRGVATLTFVVNPVQPWLAEQDAIDATRAAAATWAAAHPAIRIDYRGTTTALPTLGDGVNEIGWGNTGRFDTLATATVLVRNGKVLEADIQLNPAVPWGWSRCAPREGSCVGAEPDAGLLRRYDVQAVLTHEFGHWLGLGHLDAASARDLTMYTNPLPGDRKQDTLALGDVKGLYAAYPCRRCAQPRIVAP